MRNSENLPKILGSSVAYDSPHSRLRVDTIQLDKTNYAVREIVERPNAVVIVPVDSIGAGPEVKNFYMVRQYRHAVREYLLEFPAGKIDGDEEPADCARRELQEEIGFFPHKLWRMGSFYMSPGYSTERMYAYWASELIPYKLEGDEVDIEIVHLSFREIRDKITEGEIKDAKSILAFEMWVGSY